MAAVSKSSRVPDLEQRFHSGSPERTFSLGAGLGKVIEQGDFVGLMGELGAGKTQFVRGVAAGAAVPSAQVASPSFAIVYPYQGRITLHHADLFRVADYDELYATGFTELASGEGAMLVEWLDRVPQAAPPDLLLLHFEFGAGDQDREITARAFGERPLDLLRRWLGAGG
jgi:tRNA threonylcarbamoyladenosine biosynthesis protein TsaE